MLKKDVDWIRLFASLLFFKRNLEAKWEIWYFKKWPFNRIARRKVNDTISTLTEKLFDSSRTYDLASNFARFSWLVYFEGTADIRPRYTQRSNGGEIFKAA